MSARGAKWTRRELLGASASWALALSLKPTEPNLFRYLRQAGYDVFLFGKNDVLAPETLADSVTEWRNPRNPAAEFAAIDKPQFPNTMLLPPGGDRRGTVDYAVIQLAIQVLERRQTERPFCLFLALFEPHPPYTISADFYDLYKSEEHTSEL